MIARARVALIGRAAAAVVLTLALAGSGVEIADASEPEVYREPQLNIPAGWRIIQGDILVREAEYQKRLAGIHSGFQPQWTWPGGVVPVGYDTSVTNTPARLAAIQTALTRLGAIGGSSNVTFPVHTFEPHWIRFHADSGNFSPVGRQGGVQEIHISSWGSVPVIMHEIMHSLGFWHEQSRVDRDTYVAINLGNVCQTCCSGGSCNHNFALEGGSYDYAPYDFGSVMHYGRCDFLAPGLMCTPANFTVAVKPPYTAQWQDQIGQRLGLSVIDSLTIAFLYAKPDWRFVDGASNAGSPQGTFVNPWTSFATALGSTPADGRLFAEPGNYFLAGPGFFSQPMKVEAPRGLVQLSVFSLYGPASIAPLSPVGSASIPSVPPAGLATMP